MIHVYSVANDISNGTIDLGILNKEILVAGLTFDRIKLSGDVLCVFSDEAKINFDPVVAAHSASVITIYEGVVEQAIEFFTEEMIHFAAENVTMGITVAGKTKDVADYLTNVMRYGQSGSLYEVINEINALKLAGVPADLSPFISDSRLDAFKELMEEYLGI